MIGEHCRAVNVIQFCDRTGSPAPTEVGEVAEAWRANGWSADRIFTEIGRRTRQYEIMGVSAQ